MWPEYKSTFGRQDDLKSDVPDMSVEYKDHVNMWVKDVMRTVDYLETRDDIAADRLAYYGLSWGGSLGPIVTAVEPRFKASVLVVAGLNFTRALPEAEVLNFVTRVRTPTLIINGRYDNFFPVETSQKPLYQLLGVPEDQVYQDYLRSNDYILPMYREVIDGAVRVHQDRRVEEAITVALGEPGHQGRARWTNMRPDGRCRRSSCGAG